MHCIATKRPCALNGQQGRGRDEVVRRISRETRPQCTNTSNNWAVGVYIRQQHTQPIINVLNFREHDSSRIRRDSPDFRDKKKKTLATLREFRSKLHGGTSDIKSSCLTLNITSCSRKVLLFICSTDWLELGHTTTYAFLAYTLEQYTLANNLHTKIQ